MSYLANSSTPHKHNSSLTARSTTDWREWWAIESRRVGSDWPSVLGLHLSIVDSLRVSS
jgi:hypothetical protein